MACRTPRKAFCLVDLEYDVELQWKGERAAWTYIDSLVDRENYGWMVARSTRLSLHFQWPLGC